MIGIFSGPSGVGKGTLVKVFLAADSRSKMAVSFTTRSQRPNEVDGKDYHFVSKDKFKQLIRQGAFAEWAEVHGNLYGTPKEELLRIDQCGYDAILDIDCQGTRQLKLEEEFADAVAIFLYPPSRDELERRLRGRKSGESEEVIQKRLKNAQEEIAQMHLFDAWMEADNLENELRTATFLINRVRNFGKNGLDGFRHRMPPVIPGFEYDPIAA